MSKKKQDNAEAKKIRTSVSLEPEDYEEVERLAERNRVSIAWVIREAVKDYLRQQQPLFRQEKP